ncbi:hypothetical protein BT67DRAFT_479391 [Trichocladium antarcticum]|uniref:ORC6 first cyclin-like domain-containing protein n=1 Tax=Trichocladium antarcticum TaxID=1450529 RepID=A0AAN6UI70_9PEZI|nr:hypothetical protein BT67DRAFT_479391 [Trichocladium antarcticum]
MNRSIEQALLSLLPTHNSTLPRPLTELASSLLAQSRNRASTLKAEEEVARHYACAHLACDRLKITLNLPPIDPRPPVPPRIYKRLYSHLDSILPAPASTPSRATPGGTGLGSARVRTPSTRLREQQLLGTSPLADKSRRPPSRTTPGKEKSLAQLRNPSAANTPSKSGVPKDALPRWIRPTLRRLTAALGPAHIGPVVASGVESVIAPGGTLTGDAWVLTNMTPVLGALYLYVWRGVTWPGRELDRARYVGFRKEVAAVIGRAKAEAEILGEQEGDWVGWREVGVREFDTAALRGNRHGWFEMEWVSGVGDLADREMDREEREGGGGDEGRDGAPQVQRADTMFQERYDYLGERKRKAYGEWKAGMMKRIKELEA